MEAKCKCNTERNMEHVEDRVREFLALMMKRTQEGKKKGGTHGCQ